MRQYPSLINCCTIDWFQAWPEDALERVAHKYLEHVEVEDEEKVATIQICKYFHTSATDLSNRYSNKYIYNGYFAVSKQQLEKIKLHYLRPPTLYLREKCTRRQT